MRFIELGIGNRWFLRTETELPDGTEIEQRGIAHPIQFQSIYIRLWIRKTVFILDSKEGFKKFIKDRNAVKLIVGVRSF